MHELWVANALLEAVLEKGKGLKKIEEVHVSVGCLAMVNMQQIEFGFRMLSKGTPAEEAKIFLKPGEAKLRCSEGHETNEMIECLDFSHLLPIIRCRICGGVAQIIEGKEILLTRIVGE